MLDSKSVLWILLMPCLMVLALLLSGAAHADTTCGPYLDQTPPGSTPQIFAPGLVTTDRNEHFGPTFSPDGDMIIWTYFTRECGMQMVQLTNNGWSDVQGLSFNEPFKEDGPYFSPDGRRLYFYSQRPVADEEKNDWDIWYVDRLEHSWSAPVNPGPPLNSADNEIFLAVTADLSIYFCTLGPPRIMWRSQYTKGVYGPPVRLPDIINTDLFYSHPHVAADESYLIFSSTRLGGHGSADLYITYRTDNGWSTPRNLGSQINTAAAERSPCITPDQKYLFFVRHQLTDQGGGYCCGDVYWVSAKIPGTNEP